MKLNRKYPQIAHVVVKSQYEATRTMMRLQEFYESPIPSIRGKYFTLDYFMDAYATHYGNFTYCSDWSGFNIPGNIVRKFYVMFADLDKREYKLFNLLQPYIEKYGDNFYLILTWNKDDVKHELAHAFFYLFPPYKEAMTNLVEKLPNKQKIFKELEKMGYMDKVLIDEAQAYKIDDKAKRFLKIFQRYY